MAWVVQARGPVVLASELALNSSNKTLTAADFPKSGSGSIIDEVEILAVRIEYTATATVGNRDVRVQLLDELNGDDVIVEFKRATNLTAGQAVILEVVSSNFPFASTPLGGTEYVFIPRAVMCSGIKLKVFDAAAIDAAADDMVVIVKGLAI